MIYVHAIFTLVLTALISYFSFAWANIRTCDDDLIKEKSKIFIIKEIAKEMKSLHNGLTLVQWLSIVAISLVSTLTVISAYYQKFDNIYIIKILIILLVLSSVAVLDFQTRKIPNVLSLVLIVSRIVFLPFEYIFEKENFTMLVISSVIGLLVTFIVLLFLTKLTKNGFGMGDVKIFSSIGFIGGISSVIATMLFSTILGALIGIFLILVKKKSKKDTVPFGPLIFLGFSISIFLSIF